MKRLFFLLAGLMIFAASTSDAQINPPKNVKASVFSSMMNFTSVLLSWESDMTMEHTDFNVYRKHGAAADTGTFQKLWKTRENKFVDHAVELGKKYSYYVTAISNTQESVPSETIEVDVTFANDIVAKADGKVFDESSLNPLGRARVEFIPTAFMSGPPSFAVTDSLGLFKLKLKPGEYFVFTAAEGYFPEFYDNAQYMNQATKVSFKSGDSLSFAIGLKQFVKPTLFSISGVIKDAAGNGQKAAVTAIVTNRRENHAPEPGGHCFVTRTDELGNFKVFARENDTIVLFVNPLDLSLLKQYYNNKLTFETADKIVVSQDITGLEVTLASKTVYANGISGTVTDSATTSPLEAKIYAYQRRLNNHKGSRNFVLTDSLTGTYSLANLEPGTYYLLAAARGYRPSFFKYDGTSTRNWRDADSIIVTESGIVSDVNFTLRHIDSAGNAIVYGYIHDGNGNNVEGAVASLLDENGNVVSATISELDGSFVLEGLASGSYQLSSSAVDYNSAQINNVTVETANNYVSVDLVLTEDGLTLLEPAKNIVSNYSLSQNYPNPFNPSTLISYQLPSSGLVTIKVYNVIGKEIATLVNEFQQSGNYSKEFSANGLTSGVYFYTIKSGNFLATKKMILLK